MRFIAMNFSSTSSTTSAHVAGFGTKRRSAIQFRIVETDVAEIVAEDSFRSGTAELHG